MGLQRSVFSWIVFYIYISVIPPVMIQFTARGVNLLSVAQVREFLEMGRLLGTGLLFFIIIFLTSVKKHSGEQ